jgi:L-aspartate oxidase
LYHEGIAATLENVSEVIDTDFLIVGAGVAGLRAAIELAPAGRVLIVAKDTLQESSTQYAQGGIAAALSDDDEVELHEQDTINAGAGLCDAEAVRVLVEEGPGAIQQLIEWGTEFDREGAKLLFAREGAHSRNRVLHAHGDSTGAEIGRTLYKKACSLRGVEFRSFSAVTDLLLDDGEVAGAIACDESRRGQVRIHARAVLLASGGLGRVFRETTNPPVATGDGVACAYRAGAVISDIEFVQFHPTALFLENAPRFLLTEALRGEGAYLRNASGERFMQRFHEMAELAPRDVVSRSIVAEIERTGSPVYLDVTHLGAEFLRTRFPRVYETCRALGFDLATTPTPVHPAAHYAMGGVKTDLDGRTNIARLYAAGEVACTGVHGANRLASNSLLEGVVFGARAGAYMRNSRASVPDPHAATAPPASFPCMSEVEVRSLAWEACGIARNGHKLAQAIEHLASSSTATAGMHASRKHHELRNMHLVTSLIARCALAREESRGGHYRTDFPDTQPEFRRHSTISRDHAVAFT